MFNPQIEGFMQYINSYYSPSDSRNLMENAKKGGKTANYESINMFNCKNKAYNVFEA